MEFFFDSESKSLVIWTGGIPVLEVEFPIDKLKELIARAEKEKATRIVWAVGSGSPMEVVSPEGDESVELPLFIPFLSSFKPETQIVNLDGKIPVLMCYPAVVDEKILNPKSLEELKEKYAKYEKALEEGKTLPNQLRKLADLIERGEISEEEFELVVLLGEMLEAEEVIESAKKIYGYVQEAKKLGVSEIDADEVEKRKLYEQLKKKLRGEPKEE